MFKKIIIIKGGRGFENRAKTEAGSAKGDGSGAEGGGLSHTGR